jgi:peptide/nickel transport system substrate-binding protein
MMRQRLALSWISLLLVFGCGRPDRNASADSTAGPPVPGDWIIVRHDAEPDTLNPLMFRGATSHYTLFGGNNGQVYEFLLRYNTDTWRLTEPLLTYTFKIREGARWHDGKPLTPEDVLFTHKAVMCTTVDAAPQRSFYTELTNVEIIDGGRVRFTFRKPDVMNLHNAASQSAIIPKHVFDPDGLLDGFSFGDIIGPKGKTDPKVKEFGDRFNKHPNNRAPVGAGPYKFEKWDTGKEIVLARNDDYWGPKAHLDKIVYRIISDSSAALTALKAGEVDLMPRLQGIQYAEQTGGAAFDAQFTKTRYSIPQYFYIGWNHERPFFKDKRVRQALTMLVNRQQIIETNRFGLGADVGSHFGPGSPYLNPNIKPYPYDPKRAAELLDEAGWTDHDGDGIRDKDGVPFRFEFLGQAGSAFSKQLSAILKDEFRKAGIDMTERTLEFTVFVSTVSEHKFDAAPSAWTSPLETDPYQIFHSSASKDRGSNWVSFHNAESDRLLETARVEFDVEKRKQILWRWQQLAHEEQPYTFLFHTEDAAVYHKRFQNAEWIPNRPGYDLKGWFVPKSSQRYTAAALQ